MKPVLFFSALLFITACFQNQQNNSDTADNVKDPHRGEKIDTLCFLRTSGLVHQDTSYIRIVVDGAKVEGSYAHIPYEKDSRKGVVRGSINDGLIQAVWSFMQEGIKDSLPVEFKIQGNKLFQKEYSADPETGHQFLSDTAAYSLEYEQVRCTY